MILLLKDAERRQGDLGLDDLPLVEVAAAVRPLPKGWFEEFRRERRRLLTELVRKDKEELMMMGLPIDDIVAMLGGKKIPAGVSVKFRVPPIYGGDISAENMFICRAASEGRAIDIFIAGQAGAENFFAPNPSKSVYVTSMKSMNSPGGNSTSDRMSDVLATDVMGLIGGGRA
ncbi:MAG: hypothetical protein FWD33_00540 [Alphaproteobacteria bacterium]|nr:hypothetical protein [Alphaproteobacteria bacterium]